MLSRTGTIPRSEKPCFQFQNEGTCRFGETHKFSHDSEIGVDNKVQRHKKLLPIQKKDVKALVASGLKKALQTFAKKRKSDETSEDDTDLVAIIASCMLSHTTKP